MQGGAFPDRALFLLELLGLAALRNESLHHVVSGGAELY